MSVLCAVVGLKYDLNGCLLILHLQIEPHWQEDELKIEMEPSEDTELQDAQLWQPEWVTGVQHAQGHSFSAKKKCIIHMMGICKEPVLPICSSWAFQAHQD